MSEFDKDLIENDDDNEECFITLTDDNGDDIHFELLDSFDHNNHSYAVLVPFEDVDDEVVILEVLENNSEEPEYISVEDEILLNELFEIFKSRNSDIFDFED